MTTPSFIREAILKRINEAPLTEILALASSLENGTPTPAPMPQAEPAKRAYTRVNPEDLESVLARVIEILKSRPSGLRSENLTKEVGLDKRVVLKAVYLGLESDQLKKTGEKRATTYFLPNAAQASGRVVSRKK